MVLTPPLRPIGHPCLQKEESADVDGAAAELSTTDKIAKSLGWLGGFYSRRQIVMRSARNTYMECAEQSGKDNIYKICRYVPRACRVSTINGPGGFNSQPPMLRLPGCPIPLCGVWGEGEGSRDAMLSHRRTVTAETPPTHTHTQQLIAAHSSLHTALAKPLCRAAPHRTGSQTRSNHGS